MLTQNSAMCALTALQSFKTANVLVLLHSISSLMVCVVVVASVGVLSVWVMTHQHAKYVFLGQQSLLEVVYVMVSSRRWILWGSVVCVWCQVVLLALSTWMYVLSVWTMGQVLWKGSVFALLRALVWMLIISARFVMCRTASIVWQEILLLVVNVSWGHWMVGNVIVLLWGSPSTLMDTVLLVMFQGVFLAMRRTQTIAPFVSLNLS